MATYRSHTHVGYVSGTPQSVTKPTGTAEGDILLLFVATTTGSTPTCSGFTFTSSLGSGDGFDIWLGYKIAGASEGSSYSVADLGSNSIILMECHQPASGYSIDNPTEIEGFVGGGTATAYEWNSGEANILNGSAGDSYVTWGSFEYSGSTGVTPEAGFTEALDGTFGYLAYEDNISAENTDIQHTWSGGKESFAIGVTITETADSVGASLMPPLHRIRSLINR